MSNLKHAATAIASIAIIGSLAVSQLGELVYRPVDETLLSHGVSDTITISDEIVSDEATDARGEEDEVSSEVADARTVENEENVESDITVDMSEEELAQLIEKKSKPAVSYVMITSGVLDIKAEASDEAQTIDAVECQTQVHVLSTSEGWCLVEYSGGKQGYVPADKITESKEEAEFAAKHYDNYMKAMVTPQNENSAVRVRKGPSTSAETVVTLKSGDTVLLLWNEGDFVKVLYEGDYREGYMVASALTMTYEWVPKTEVEAVRAEAARKAAEAKRQAEEAAKKAREEAAKNAAKTIKSSSKVKSSASANAPASSKGQAIVNTAKKYLGVKYVYGGSTPSGFDCSGLVKYVCAKNGISLSRTSASQSRQGVTVSKSNLQPGDLLFFAKNGRVHHVGIYAGNGQMIHAPHTGSYVKFDSINTAYRQKEFYCAKRVY